jgi:hypothetical protein
LCIPLFLVIAISSYEIPIKAIIILILMALLFGSIFYYLLTMKKIDFDDRHIYFKGGNVEVKVPLENILAIKLSMNGINGKNFWLLTYRDDNGNERKLNFVPKRLLVELFRLEDLIRIKNAHFKLMGVASSLDS